MIVDMINNKELNSIITTGTKLNISLVLSAQSFFKVPRDFRLNTTHFFISKIPNRRELQEIATNHSSVLKILLISIENVLLNHILF